MSTHYCGSVTPGTGQGRRRCGIGILAATLVSFATAIAWHAPPAHAADVVERGQAFRVGGEFGFGRVFAHPQPLPPELRGERDERFSEANPSPPEGAPTRPAGGPKHPATDDTPPGASAAAARAARTSTARAAAADDFELWRNQPVAQGAGVTATIGEPTVANDRNAVLYTGNWHAAVSGDDGLTWSYLNPATQFPSLNGGFCCDQVAYAVDRGSSSLIFWLMQYSDDEVNGGALRLVVYQGRDELLDQANYCSYVITSATINESGAKWFDFNVVASTDDHLFISSKVLNSAGDTFSTGVVMRWDLNDFDDGNCTLNTGRVYKDATGGAQNTALAQGAGSTMYWGKRTANGQIDIWELPDGTNGATHRTRTVSTWATSNSGSSACPVPDGTDPCNRANDKLNVAFIHDGKLVFAWNVAQGNGFAFPHIRMARFDLSTMNLVDEPDVWNPNYAWAYAAAGINADGHLGLSLYRIGGGESPRARVALVDDVDTNIDSLNVHGIVTSDAGTAGSTKNPLGRWGDYAAVRPYGNCPNTFAGAVHSQQGGNLDANSEHRFVWFGRQRDGCADMIVSALAADPTEIDPGGELSIDETTRNIGSADAGSSTTRFYLSRDPDQSNDDLALAQSAAHAALGPGDSQALRTVAEVPDTASGTYYLLACADDDKVVAELTNTNNCAETGTVRVPLATSFQVSDIATPQWLGHPAGSGFTATLRVARPRTAPLRGGRVWAAVWLSRSSRRTGAARLVASRRLPAASSRRLRRYRMRARIPARSAPGDYRVIACVAPARRKPEARRCLTAPHPLHVIARKVARRHPRGSSRHARPARPARRSAA